MEPSTSPYRVVLLAAGSGTRFGGALPKQWTTINGQRPVEIAARAFLADPRCTAIALVVARDFQPLAQDVVQRLNDSRLYTCLGGNSREQSTRLGLDALEAEAPQPNGAQRPSFVLIHDAARPLVQLSVVERLLKALDQGATAVVPVLPVVDTIKHAQDARTLDRSMLRRAQTPQGFPVDLIISAHSAQHQGTDDASLIESMGHPVTLVQGHPHLHKLTTQDDKHFLEAMMHSQREVRTGLGFDVHAFMADDNAPLDNGDIAHRKELVLGGVSIPATVKGARPLAGHSDADVVLHAVTDALLGAMGDGDIGQHFPPSAPQWRGAASDLFLKAAAQDIMGAKFDGLAKVINIDITVMCEQPKIGPFRPAMEHRIADICGIAPTRVNLKATTTERLGFTGRGEGIACQAIATIEVPARD